MLGKIVKTLKVICGQEARVKVVTVMPCYDKKLEAVRPSMLVPDQDKTELQPHMEVDTVLATHELLELFEKLQIDFKSVEPFVSDESEFLKHDFQDEAEIMAGIL